MNIWKAVHDLKNHYPNINYKGVAVLLKISEDEAKRHLSWRHKRAKMHPDTKQQKLDSLVGNFAKHELAVKVYSRSSSIRIGPTPLALAFYEEQARIRKQERRLAISSTPFTLTEDEWYAICEAFDNRCLKCGSTENITIDHVIPISRGGRHDKSNVQPTV